MIRSIVQILILMTCAGGLLAGNCPGGGGGGAGGRGTGTGPVSCDGSCPQRALSVDQVERIVAQAVAESLVQGVASTTVAVDRAGNVLAVFKMNGARDNTTITSNRGVTSGLEGLSVPSFLAAISKAGTAAYLSSQGNAFSTRTANHIIQENFNPGETDRAGGPLFGVQFSQLLCGSPADIVRRFDADARAGPKAMPLGFSADPGGLPLYIDGVLVGGVGIEFDGEYTGDANILDFDSNLEEKIATAASFGFAAPVNRRANRIAVDGRFLRFADDEKFDATPSDVLPFGDLPGSLISVPGFFGFFEPDGLTKKKEPEVRDGVMFLSDESGVVRSDNVYEAPAEVLVRMGVPRFNPRDSGNPTPPTGLTAEEVRVLIREALNLSARARAQIRQPGGSAARVNISVVDLNGTLLGFARSPDAPVFGMDVSLQKARTAAFFSSPTAAADLSAAADPLDPSGTLERYVVALREFLGDPTALSNGVAFSDRAGGNLSRPFFPDGINGNPNGPLSRPFADWSPFSTGLQLDAVLPQLFVALCPVVEDDPATCPAPPGSCMPPELSEVGNGFQIFPGSVPIFRGDVLIGGIGISGDGVDQDDLVAFLGLHEAGRVLSGAISNAPPAIRADTIEVGGVHLRYVSCPPSPFLDSSAQNVCGGK